MVQTSHLPQIPDESQITIQSYENVLLLRGQESLSMNSESPMLENTFNAADHSLTTASVRNRLFISPLASMEEPPTPIPFPSAFAHASKKIDGPFTGKKACLQRQRRSRI